MSRAKRSNVSRPWSRRKAAILATSTDWPARKCLKGTTSARAAPKDGWIAGIDGGEVGHAAMGLGAGRERADQPIDHVVGVILRKKVGDQVRQGERIADVIAQDPERAAEGQGASRRRSTWTTILCKCHHFSLGALMEPDHARHRIGMFQSAYG